MSDAPPGAVRAATERTGAFAQLVKTLPADAVVVADRRVLRLHPAAAKALSKHRVVPLAAGEATKSLAMVERLAERLHTVPRTTTFVALGGGTIGDLMGVYAHLHKRGARLIQVPTTLLAAVDSSLGGKGAVNVGGLKNALGVFHAPEETWLCPAFFATLSEAQRREGRLEAWKMVVTLDAATFRRWMVRARDELALVREARGLKQAVVKTDPYERRGLRVVLNFGHTFGHVLESLSGYRLPHGDAVGLGMLCALDVGVALGVTPPGVAAVVEEVLPNRSDARRALARIAASGSVAKVAALLAGDKKAGGGRVKMVLLEDVGQWVLAPVEASAWRACWRRWSGRG